MNLTEDAQLLTETTMLRFNHSTQTKTAKLAFSSDNLTKYFMKTATNPTTADNVQVHVTVKVFLCLFVGDVFEYFLSISSPLSDALEIPLKIRIAI